MGLDAIPLRAFVTGSTGAVGKAIVKALGGDSRYSSIKLIQRRDASFDYGPNPIDIESRFSTHIIDFEQLEMHKNLFADTDIGFCALGTTMAKSGKTKMRTIDHDYVLKIAELCSAAGCKQFHLVSSQGANPNSLFFYLRLKGEIERDLIAQKFPFTQLVIYQPSTLICAREEVRRLEKVFQSVLKTVGPSSLQMPVDDLAVAMIGAPFNEEFLKQFSPNDNPGVSILPNSNIYQLALLCKS